VQAPAVSDDRGPPPDAERGEGVGALGRVLLRLQGLGEGDAGV